jgi:hypothetical protein
MPGIERFRLLEAAPPKRFLAQAARFLKIVVE